MKKIMILAAWVAATQITNAASTNLNYTVAEINEALGNALAMTNATQFETSGSSIASNLTYSGWTPMDLSSAVGTNYALAMIRITDLSGAQNDIRFRQNGSGLTIGAGDGLTARLISAGGIGYFWVPTDSSGWVELQTGGAVEVVVENYVTSSGGGL